METPQTLIDALGLHELSPEDQEKMLLELSSLVFKGSLVRLIERMDDDTKEAFNDLLDMGPEEEAVQEFLQNNVPGASQVVAEVIEELKNDILASTSESSD